MLLNLSIPKGAGIGRDGQASIEWKARTTRQRTHLELGFGTYALRPPETVQLTNTLSQRVFSYKIFRSPRSTNVGFAHFKHHR